VQVARGLAGGVEVQPGLVGGLMGVGGVGVADQLGRIAGRRVVRAIGQFAIESVLDDDGVANKLLAKPLEEWEAYSNSYVGRWPY